MSEITTGDVTNGITLLNQATGYGMVVGLGVLFAGIILIAVRVQRLYLEEDSGTSEMFMVANRSVGTGLTASAVFSSWMWINETVFSCVMCYRYGISGPFWFATGCSFQIALMGVLGVLSKLRVPYAHTSLEIIRMRYGPLGHFIFAVLNLINNVFGCSSMILAGSQLIVGISGMHVAAATILLPLGVVLYTAVGGLKATFITDFIHTTIALLLIIWFTLGVLTSETIGGISGFQVQGRYHVWSHSFIWKSCADDHGNPDHLPELEIFPLTKLQDTGFWQKSFASDVHATVPGYDLAAIAIFAVPWGLGTVLGLSARVIETLPIFPTYPNAFSAAQVGAGYVEPYTLYAILGTGGAVGMLLCLFMSVTSTVSSSMIAVSSILSFDLYRTYINPKATDNQVTKASHLGVVFHGVFITGIALTLNYGGANMTWVNYVSPILSSPAVFPVFFTLMWPGQTRLAATISPILGLVTGITVWLISSWSIYGSVSLGTTVELAPSLYGAVGSLFSPILYSVVISYIKPGTFDWREFLRLEEIEEENFVSNTDTPKSPDISKEALGTSSSSDEIEKIGNKSPETVIRRSVVRSFDEVEHPFDAQTLVSLRRWSKVAWAVLIFILAITFVLWPLPLYRDYVFNKAFFSGWIVVAIFWQFLALFAVVVYPIYDGRREISKSFRGIWKSLAEKRI